MCLVTLYHISPSIHLYKWLPSEIQVRVTVIPSLRCAASRLYCACRLAYVPYQHRPEVKIMVCWPPSSQIRILHKCPTHQCCN